MNIISYCILIFTSRSLKDPGNRTVEHFIKEILYIGRIYDYGTENEYLVTEFQQFMDSTGGTSSSSNNSTAYSFENIVIRVYLINNVN